MTEGWRDRGREEKSSYPYYRLGIEEKGEVKRERKG